MRTYKIVLKASFDQVAEELLANKGENKTFNDIAMCNSLEECSKKALSYIRKYNISQNHWNGGQIYVDNKYYGRIWYDGTFYKPEDEKGKLPKLDDQINEANLIKEILCAKPIHN